MTTTEVRAATVAASWATVPVERSVLVVVHNVTTLNRLLDVLGVFEADLRVQLTVTSDLSDPFAEGLPEEVAALGLPTMPWQQATRMGFDLVLSASHHGDITDLTGPLVIMPHGNGFGKLAPGDDAGERGIFGLAPEWLLNRGEPFARALVFSHPEQVDRLAATVPEAVPTAAVVGDPCYDRMLASLPWRQRYRAALGVPDDRPVVLVSSTWGGRALLGAWPELVRELVAELPADAYRVLLVAHPNVWYWHGPYQLRSWYADCLRDGLVLVPPLHGWQAAVVAADCVLGDHGSVTAYAAALGRATLLAAYPEEDVVPGSPAHHVGQLAGRLRRGSLRTQIDAALAAHAPERFAPVAEVTSAVPGESAARLRALFYDLLDLPEPVGPAVPATVPPAGLTPPAPLSAAWVTAAVDHTGVRVERHPVEATARLGRPAPAGAHLAIHHGDPSRDLHAAADVVFGHADEIPGDPYAWLAETRRRHPRCVTAAVLRDDGCLIADRSGTAVTLTTVTRLGPATAVLASAAHAWTATGRPLPGARFDLRLSADMAPTPVTTA